MNTIVGFYKSKQDWVLQLMVKRDNCNIKYDKAMLTLSQLGTVSRRP